MTESPRRSRGSDAVLYQAIPGRNYADVFDNAAAWIRNPAQNGIMLYAAVFESAGPDDHYLDVFYVASEPQMASRPDSLQESQESIE